MDGKPAEADSLLARPFALATRLVLRYPVAVVALASGLAIVALIFTGARLGYRTSRLDLLNPKSDYNRLWIEYINEFGDEDDAVIVVEGANREQIVPVLDELSRSLARENRLFHAVLHEVDLSKIRAKGLHYLSADELHVIEGFVNQVQPILSGDWSQLNLGNTVTALSAGLQPGLGVTVSANMAAQLDRVTAGMLAALGQRSHYQPPWPDMPDKLATLSDLNSEYLLAPNGKFGFVLLRIATGADGFTHGTEATDALRELIAETSARHPETRIGLTGLPIMENDEMRSSQTSMFWASVVSMVGVSCLFVAGFGGLRHALIANMVLLIGMAWAFGYVTLSVGHLNILSVTFTVTLIGIGIDYGVYYVSRYMQLRNEELSCGDALVQTGRTIGPAITTGCITTAVSFFAAGMTNFTGVAELGIIAGGGLILCAISQLFVLPAAIWLLDRSKIGQKMPQPLPVHTWIQPLLKAPRLTFFSMLGITVLIAGGLSRLWYDHNLLNMQPVGLESVELERRLLSECDQSVWYALSIADSREELLARKAQFLKLPSVERTEEIVSLLPADHEVKQPIIARIEQRLAKLPERPPLIPVDPPEDLGRVLGEAQELVMAHGRTFLGCARQLEQVRDLLRRTPLDECYARLSQYQHQTAGDLLSRLHALKEVAHPEPPKLEDLPESLVHRFVGHNGRHLLKIYARGNIWDIHALKRFVYDVRGVDPRVTGNPLQAYEASLEMKESYQLAALYALLIIAVVLLVDFRGVRMSLLAALPLGVSMLQLFGLLGLLNIPLNPANLIALPLVLGIGIDYGVHIVHEFRQQTGPYKLKSATAIAVMVDGLTTIVGFGSLMVASHQGLQSLGRVLTLGITCCTITSLIMLPALLTWITRNRQEEKPVEESEHWGEWPTVEPVPSAAYWPDDPIEIEPRTAQPDRRVDWEAA